MEHMVSDHMIPLEILQPPPKSKACMLSPQVKLTTLDHELLKHRKYDPRHSLSNTGVRKKGWQGFYIYGWHLPPLK